MLLVRTEYKKGVLFVRLKGRLDNEGYLEKIHDLIEEFGIRIAVLNISRLSNVSLENINYMIKWKNILKRKRHLLFICDDKDSRNSLFRSVKKISREGDIFAFLNRKGAYE